ncbi:UDP-N-acetylmuramate--L-alanine ligase [Desulfogranum mediterraneum]|uniref:UDP-N-acetylmuramate--L-alanine ligase n=1 Tax=Desulfogranum mediterraneum TaxID=160661 RepID=UPI00041A12F9|nr:UDP-N-acetylmuramate--L-alanine ligase [Desulfogranum mediterraneum]
MYRKTKHIHFVGIGGIGMSGIAELLLNLGYRVSGSDLQSTEITRRLESLGGIIHRGHQAAWVAGADVVVTSTAIAGENPEVVQAREEHIPVIPRAEMLAELMRLKKYGIAVAGSHGKTSTTSLLASILGEAGLDPTVVVGGKVAHLGGSNAKLGEGEFLVAEADESDGSFLKLSPVIEVVTNIDLEHLDYYRDLDHIKEVFLEFINRLPFYGAAVVCFDDENIAQLLPRIRKRTITYGLTEQADIYATRIVSHNGESCFTVRQRGRDLGEVRLRRPGRHTIYNSLAAIAVGLELEIDFEVIAGALADFQGVERRLEVKGEANGVLVVDDYGHHPTEIRATLDAVREAWPERRLVVAFQPHRYSRTQGLFNDFITAFHRADVLILTDIYPASEAPIEGVSSQALREAIREHGQRQTYLIPELITDPQALLSMVEPNDLVLTLGAGNIVRSGEQLLALLDPVDPVDSAD